VVGLVWGALIAAALVVRLRYLLHFAVLEAALEAASTGGELKDTARGTAYCPSCEMPLLVGANFCVACGTSVRAGSKVTRARNRTDDVAPDRPTLAPTPAGVAPNDNKKTALVVGAVAGAILLGGLIGQVVAAAADGSDEAKPPSESPITIDPAAGDDQLSKTPAVRFGSEDDGLEGKTVEAAGSDQIVTLGDDVYVLVPKGFRIDDPGPEFLQVFGFKGYFFAYLSPKKTTVPKLITNNLTGIQNMGVEELQITQPTSVQVSGVQSAGTLNFRGLLATQQGGSIPVEGFAYYFVRSDGTGATAFALYGKGSLKPKSKLLNGYNTMLNTMISTL
jgi:hypothetical protein